MAADRRRINGPAALSRTPLYHGTIDIAKHGAYELQKPEVRKKLFLKRGICPSATGSAYLEQVTDTSAASPRKASEQALKLVCAIHGPKPLSRQSTYTPVLTISTYVKFAPFAGSQRKGYLRDSAERELSSNLEAAIRSIVIGANWPKSGLDVILTVLEMPGVHNDESWSIMSTLAGCITVTTLAMLDAGLECNDLVSGGFAARLSQPGSHSSEAQILKEASIATECVIHGACVVAYGKHTGEIFSIWSNEERKDGSETPKSLIDSAIAAAQSSHAVLQLVCG